MPLYEFFEKERGIRRETLDDFGAYLDEGAMAFPYPDGIKKRRQNPDGTRQFFYEGKGTRLGLFRDKNAVGTKTMFLVEGETDTMRLYQELQDANRLTVT